MKIRHIALAEIAGLHPLLAATLAGSEMQYLVPDRVFTRDGVLALLECNPIPVAKLDGTWLALADSRLLTAARTHLEPNTQIRVLDCFSLESEGIEVMIWNRLALHYLFSAQHPRGYAAGLDFRRNAMPKPLIARWCPSIASKRKFSDATGIARNTFGERGAKRTVTSNQPDEATPLERIRQRVLRD